MDRYHRDLAQELRQLGSKQAADWLIANCPEGSPECGTALQVMAHVSWKKSDRMRLARHYLAQAPYPNPLPYKVLHDILTRNEFAEVIGEIEVTDENDRQLLAYHLQSFSSGQ